jgi:hypothetical protein
MGLRVMVMEAKLFDDIRALLMVPGRSYILGAGPVTEHALSYIAACQSPPCGDVYVNAQNPFGLVDILVDIREGLAFANLVEFDDVIEAARLRERLNGILDILCPVPETDEELIAITRRVYAARRRYRRQYREVS